MTDSQLRTGKPLLTFALITYRQEQFVAEAVRGALSQTYSPLEIILSDDCSPDNTFKIMRLMASEYRGENSIITRQTEHNLGLVGHINDIMHLAKGELIVIAAGDDISQPERVMRIYETYLASERKACSIFSNAVWIDESGNRMNLLHKEPVPAYELTLKNYASRKVPSLVNGATHAWKKEVFDFFGPLPANARVEDVLIPFRSALLGEIHYIHDPLVLYRRDSGRIKNDVGKSSFSLHRQKWLDWQKLHADVYRYRLGDLDWLSAKNKNKQNSDEIEYVRQVTALRQTELDLLVSANTGNLTRGTSFLTTIKLKIEGLIAPLLDFLRLNLYYKYQDFQRLFRS